MLNHALSNSDIADALNRKRDALPQAHLWQVHISRAGIGDVHHVSEYREPYPGHVAVKLVRDDGRWTPEKVALSLEQTPEPSRS